MTRTETHRRAPWVRTVLILTLMLAMIGITFKLFEPIFVWSSGWQPLPSMASAPKDEQLDAEWRVLAPRLDAWLREAHRGTDAPAISAAIAIDGRRVWAAALGHADLDERTAVTRESAFRIGSSSKAVTSVAIGTLLDRGRVDLERPLKTYLPDVDEPLASISLRQAMSHTGGVRNYSWCVCFPVWEHLNRGHYDGPVRDTLRAFERDPLLFTPGTSFAYSSFGYNAAGAVVERVSGVPFLEYLQRELFVPLEMMHSGGDREGDGARAPQRAQPYETEEGRYKRAFDVDNSNKWPSGGLVSTPTDMVRLGLAMLQPSRFSAATRDRLITPQPLADGRANPQGYALGWRYSDEKKLFEGASGQPVRTTRIYSHHGTAVGSTSYFAVYPDYGLVVSIVMNKGQENIEALAPRANRLVELFLERRTAKEAR